MESVKDLLTDPTKGRNRSQGVLCYLFREVLLWRRVNQIVWNKRLTAYFEKPHNQEKPDKGNLNKALLNDDLPWAGFRKAIDFLSPLEAKLVMDFTWGDGRSASYEILIDPAADEALQYKNIFTYNECSVFAKAKKPTSTLAYLFRHIIAKEGIDEAGWDELFNRYADNPVNNVGILKTELNSSVSMMKRELLGAKLSWKLFRRGMLLLNPQQETYTLKLRWTDNPHMLVSMPDAEYSATIVNPYSEKANA